MTSRKTNPMMQRTFLEVVENQLRDNVPPETRETLVRLMGMGISESDAKILIASAVAAETYWIMKDGKPFDNERFVRNLQQLPDQDFGKK